jgi:hypothetical protein|tara:strand:- start:1762 stop:2268 length:507 start_codon:yes stop_codon:yes gene_type:complete
MSSTRKPLHIPGRRLVLTKNRILDSQSNTKSAAEAARWLGVSYPTYKKWAKYYDVFEQHKNQKGVGVKKGWASYKIPLEKFFEGEKNLPSNYSLKTLKKRLIEEGYMQEECSNCGYNEKNLLTEKVCLNLDFVDGNSKNMKFENLRLLCPNCHLSYNGTFSKSKLFCK